MPSLYGTGTTYTVTASNVITLYKVSTSSAVITATTYSTNLVGLYGGSYSALPTNAAQLIQLFDNNGNVNFYLDPATNSSTIFANFIGSVVSNVSAGAGISVSTSTGSVVISNTGVLSVTAGTNTNVSTSTGNITIWTNPVATGVSSLTAGTGISVSTSTGSVTVTNVGVTGLIAGTNTNISSTTGNITIWTTGGSTFDISTWTNQRLFTTSSVAFNRLSVTGSNISSSTVAVSVNLSGVTLTPQPNTSIWAVNRPGSLSRFVFDTYVDPDTVNLQDRSFVTGRRARNTAASPTAVQLNDVLLRVNAFGYNGTSFPIFSSAGINFTAAENFTTATQSAKITFDVMPAGGTTAGNQVNILILAEGGAFIPGGKNLSLTGGGDVLLTTTGSNITFPDGTVQTTAFTGTVAGGVTSLAAGFGISVSTSTGAVTVSNIGVLDLTGTAALGVSASTGSITLTNLGVTSLTAGTNTNISASTGSVTVWVNPTTPFDISTWTNQRLFTTSSVSFAQLTITGTNIASTQSAILVNLSGSDVYPNPGDGGYGIWQINKPGAGSNQVNDTFGDSNTAGQFSRYTGRRARGTAALPTAVQNDDILVQFQSNGFGTTDFSSTATGRLRFSATENFTDAARGTQLSIWLNKNGQIDPSVIATFNETGLKLFDAGDLLLTTGSNITFGDGTIQTTAFTGTVVSVTSLTAGPGISVNTNTGAVTVNNTGVLALTGTAALGVSASTGSITLTNLGVTSLTAGTNTNISASTGSVTIWVNNTTPFDISTWTNQRLFTTSTVQFSGMSLSTGTEVDQTVSAGGYPLDGNGQALLEQASTQSSAMVVSNYTAGIRPVIRVRGFGQNMPGGTATTSPGVGIFVEGSRGTNLAPTATQSNDVLGSLGFGGYDGANWLTNSATGGPLGFSPGQQFYLASEAWNNNGSTTTNAGTRLLMRVQPQGVQASATSRQYHYVQTWTAGSTATTAPPQMNIQQGTGDNVLPNFTPSGGVGSFGIGFGATNINNINTKNNFFGVPSTDPAADNITLSSTNFISIITNRRSGVSGRRDVVAAGDSLGGLLYYTQSANSATGIGNLVALITTTALETSSAGARGTSMGMSTVQTGTTTLSTRLFLSDRLNNHNSDEHRFNAANAGSQRLSLSTTLNTNVYNSDTHNFNVTGGATNIVQFNTSTGVALKGYSETQTTAAFTATFAPNVSTATIFAMVLTGNITFNGFTNPQAGQSAVFFFTQDATGSRLLTSSMKYAGGSKILSTAGTSTDMISVLYAGAAGYYATLVKGFV